MMSIVRPIVAALGVVLTTLAATPSQALTFGWQFVVGPDFSTCCVGDTVSGTIAGLVDGSNSGAGLTVLVTSTPTGELVGSGWSFTSTANGGDAFTVSGGSVTFADALFTDPAGDLLYFGGYGGFVPDLVSAIAHGPEWSDQTGKTSFALIAGDVPLPQTLPLFASALGMIGLLTAWRARVVSRR